MTTTAGPEQTPMDQLKENTDNNSLKKVIDEIKQLTDANDKNNNIELDGVLTTEFKDSLTSENAQILLDELNKITPAPDDPGFKDLKDFLEMVCATNPLKKGTTIDEGLTTGNEASDKAKKLIKVSKDMVDGIIGAENFSKAPDTLKTQLTNIQTILENPTKANIQELQKFLYEHVSDKNTFLDKNKDKKTKPNPATDGTVTWDGLFGENTKDSLNKFLSDAEKYIKEYGEGVSVEKNHNTKAAELKAQADAQAEAKAIQDVNDAINGITDKNITVQRVEKALAAYNNLTEAQQAKVDTTLKQKLDDFNSKCEALKTKLTGALPEMQTVFTDTPEGQQIYELTKIFVKYKFTKEEAEMITREIDENRTDFESSVIPASLKGQTDEITKIINNISKALKNIINGTGTSPDTDPAKDQEELRRNAEAQQSFDELQTELSKLKNPDINQALMNIKTRNNYLKQGHSIYYLTTEKDELEQAIKNIGGSDVKIDSEGKITEGLDKTEKKGHRQELKNLEKQLMKICKELQEKTKKKEDIVNKLTVIKASEDVTGKDYYIGLIDKYQNSLDYIGENKTDEVDLEARPRLAPEHPENTENPAEGSPSPKSSPESVRGSNQSLLTLLENLKTAFENFKRGDVWGNWALILGAFSGKTTTKDQLKGKDYIDSSNQEVTAILKDVMDKTNVNGLKEIKDVIEKGSELKVRTLQMKLWTPENNLLITGKIDKATATALKEYVNDSSNNGAEENMTYQCLEGFDTDKATDIKDDAHNLDGKLYTKTEGTNTETRFIGKINGKDCICINPTITNTGEGDSATTTMSFEGDKITIQRADGVRQEGEFKFNDETGKLELTKGKEYGKDGKSKEINPAQAEPDPQAADNTSQAHQQPAAPSTSGT